MKGVGRGKCGLAPSVFLWSLDTNRSVNAGVCMCNGRGVVWTRPLSRFIVLGHKQGELMLGCVCVCLCVLGGGVRVDLPPPQYSMVLGRKHIELMLGCVCVCRGWGEG